MSADFVLQVAADGQKIEEAIDGPDLLLILLVRFGPNFDQAADHIHKISESHAACDLHYRYEEAFYVV
jgi:hypothetical protein